MSRFVVLAAFIALVHMDASAQNAADSSAQAAQMLCMSDDAKKLSRDRYPCRSELVQFLWQGSIEQTELARVTTDYRVDIDVIYPVERFLIRLPNQEIMKLKTMPSFPAFNTTELPQFESFRVRSELLYEYRAFEVVSRKLCAVTRLKYPFVGEARNCAGRQSEQYYSAQLAPGVASPGEARSSICKIVGSDVGDCRGLRTATLEKTPEGQLVYQINARVRTSNNASSIEHAADPSRRSVHYEERTYQVNLDGVVFLRSVVKEECTHPALAEKPNYPLQATCETHAPER